MHSTNCTNCIDSTRVYKSNVCILRQLSHKELESLPFSFLTDFEKVEFLQLSGLTDFNTNPGTKQRHGPCKLICFDTVFVTTIEFSLK